MKPSITIIICTRNRVESLRQTLESIGKCNVPAGWLVELLLVDNGSTDNTRQVAEQAGLPNMPFRYILEERPGKSHGLNRALLEGEGDIFLFTDDDVRVGSSWIQGMCLPILEGQYDALTGAIVIENDRLLDWMQRGDRVAFASTEHLSADCAHSLIGANMAVSRVAVDAVGGFDIALGPGAHGYADDTFFGQRIRESGFKIGFIAEAEVRHAFDKARITRKNLLQMGRKSGCSSAYIAYHWEQRSISLSYLGLIRAYVRLYYWRLRRLRSLIRAVVGNYAEEWERGLVAEVSFWLQFLREAGSPRRYSCTSERIAANENRLPDRQLPLHR